MSYCRGLEKIAAWWLTQRVLRQSNVLLLKHKRRELSDWKKKKDFSEKQKTNKKNLLASETTLLERAAILEQVSTQNKNVLAHYSMQMHTP